MKVKVLNKSNDQLPKYETSKSAGVDVRARLNRMPFKAFGHVSVVKGENGKVGMIRISPFGRVLIPTGLFVAIPEGYEIQIRPRSGLALKEGITLANCIGTVDADYRNEIGVILINLNNEDVFIEDNERIGQLVLNKVEKIEWEEVDTLDETDRKGGFGSTGTK
jgi:dUTP pyrophosphatase